MTNFVSMLRESQKNYPVDVVGLANDLGIRVWESSKLSDDISGKLVKDERLGGQSKYAIIVNKTHAETRRRFTIAHEVAHFVLHLNSVGDGISENEFYRSKLSNKEEIEANKLAAEILMPRSLINKLKSEHGLTGAEEDVKTMADQLKASEVAMKIRLGIQI
jgi:Zn-dependent peptidase ImmA (M78 family)